MCKEKGKTHLLFSYQEYLMNFISSENGSEGHIYRKTFTKELEKKII